MEKPNFVTFSNVYDDPQKEYEYALTLRYENINIRNASPGKESIVPYNPTSPAVVKILDHFKKMNKQVQIVNHLYRIASEHQPYNALVHTDTVDYQFVISLTPHHDELNETENYYQPMNELSTVNNINYRRTKYDDELSRLERSCYKLQKWSVVDSVPMKFNEGILISTYFWHAPSVARFGDTKETSRIVEIFSINVVSDIAICSIPYIWYYQNVLNDTECADIKQFITQHIKNASQPLTISLNNVLGQYKDCMIGRCIEYYVERIISLNFDLKTLFSMPSQSKAKKNFDITGVYMPIGFKKQWNMTLNDNLASFVMMFCLNTNDVGVSVYNPLTQDPTLLPCECGSVIIVPHSWMYPLKQFVLREPKYILEVLVSFIVSE